MAKARQSSLAYWRHYAGDYLASQTVALLSAAGRGIYVHLLCHQWQARGDGLPDDMEALARLAGVKAEELEQSWPVLAQAFPLGEDGRRRNGRMQREWEIASEQHESRIRGGVRRNQDSPGWQKRDNMTSSPIAQLSKTDSSPIAQLSENDSSCLGSQNQNQNQIDTNVSRESPPAPVPTNEPKKPVKRFTPPTVEEVAAYIAEHGYPVDAVKWHAYYSSNGWKVGKNAMKDWRAAVRTWLKDGWKPGDSDTSHVKPGQPVLPGSHDKWAGRKEW